MKRSCLLFISGVIASAGISASAFAANPDSTQFSVEVKPYLNVTLSNSDVHLPITPSSTGAFGSAALTASASTNSALGYALNLSFLDSNNNLNTNLVSNTVNVNDGTYPTIPTFTTNDELTSDAFSASTSEDHLNHWAISINDTNHYKKALTESTIATSNAPIADDTTTINLATKLDLRTVPGSYSVIMKFEVVANPNPPDNNPINQAMDDAGKDPETIDGKQYYRMQDMTADICNSITTPTAADNSDTPETQLVDTRDGKLYWVAKLKDGKCWMTQNLDFNIPTTALTSVDTDLNEYNVAGYNSENGYSYSNGVISWISDEPTAVYPSNTAGYGNYRTPVSEDVGNWYWIGTPYNSEECQSTYPIEECDYLNTNTDKFNATMYPNNKEHGHVGNYYNWAAAIASNSAGVFTEGGSYGGTTPQNSICPKGWRLPGQNASGGDYDTLYSRYVPTTSETLDQGLISSPVYLVRGGNMNSYDKTSYAGNLGHYWTSEPNDEDSAMFYRFGYDDYGHSGDWGKEDARSVRCVAR